MNKTVKQWIEFLDMGDNHFIALESESNTAFNQRKIYLPIKESLEKFSGWLDEIVEDAYICNRIECENNIYHLLIIK